MECKKNCYITGQNNHKLPKGFFEVDSLRYNLYKIIDTAIEDGIYTFVFDGYSEFELTAMDVALLRKNEKKTDSDKNIKLVAVKSSAAESDETAEAQQKKFFEICDEVICFDGCEEKRRALVESCDLLVCYHGDNSDLLDYARQLGKRVEEV